MKAYLSGLEWRFGGALGGVEPQRAWLILACVAATGLLLIAASYAWSMVRLSVARKLALTTLRFGILGLVLVLLAGPVRITKQYSQPARESLRPLAVLEDRSDSMKKPDNRRQQRGEDARRRWLAIEPTAKKAFSGFQTFAFAHGMQKIESLDVTAACKGDRTDLFGAIQTVVSLAPSGGWGGVVVLTDGLDTSGSRAEDQVEATVRDAMAARTPLYFVPGRNRYTGKSFFLLRDWNMPGAIAPKSTFQLEVTIDSSQTALRTVPVRLKVGSRQKPTETFSLQAGRHLYTWTAEISSEGVGVLPVELQIGDQEQAVVAKAEVRVEAPGSNRVLFFQGALDWGYKFLSEILRGDPEFTFTPMLALAPNDYDNSAKSFPATAAGLGAYDMIVLANAHAGQFSQEQQNAVTEWVKNGGVLLFLAPDDASARGFAGGEMERMLPVVFAPGTERPASKKPERTIRIPLRLRARAVAGGDSQPIVLSEFAWEPGAQEIFGNGAAMVSPKFSSYAHVSRAKPGAIVLARHPRDPAPGGGDERAILLALQRYGRGQSAVLTSDALWRWKLNEGSDSHAVAVFWRQLFSWLGRDRTRDLVFDHAPLSAEAGREIPLRLQGVGSAAVRVSARLGNEPAASLDASLDAQGKPVFRWTPRHAGEWELSAAEENGRVARHWLRVQESAPSGGSGENSASPPDEELMITLAERTGGGVLNEHAPQQWIAPRVPDSPQLVAEHNAQLWHSPWVLAALATCYAIELLLRRRWLLL